MISLSGRIERGDEPDLAVALLTFESKTALWAWWKTVLQPKAEKTSVFRGLV
jgi:hypothetical protein